MYEHHSSPLLAHALFWRRMVQHGGAATAVIAVSLYAGTLGYHVLGQLAWVDAFENASMILGGMGPVDPIASTGGKLFASFYALYSGVVFLFVAMAGMPTARAACAACRASRDGWSIGAHGVWHGAQAQESAPQRPAGHEHRRSKD